MTTKEVLRVPGLSNRVVSFWSQVQPRWVVRTLGGLRWPTAAQGTLIGC